MDNLIGKTLTACTRCGTHRHRRHGHHHKAAVGAGRPVPEAGLS